MDLRKAGERLDWLQRLQTVGWALVSIKLLLGPAAAAAIAAVLATRDHLNAWQVFLVAMSGFAIACLVLLSVALMYRVFRGRPVLPDVRRTATRRAAHVMVRAMELGFYGDIRRRVGDVFPLDSEADFSPRWMERVPLDTPERLTSSRTALLQVEAELRGRNPEEAETMRTQDVEGVLAHARQVEGQLVDLANQLQAAREELRTTKRRFAHDQLRGISRMSFANDLRPTVTIRSAAYGTDHALVQEIENIIKEFLGWPVSKDGSNNPMLPQADKCKVVFESGNTLSFEPMANAFAEGDLLGVPVCRAVSGREDHYCLVIKVLPSPPS